MGNRWKLLIKFLKFKLKWRTILRKSLEKTSSIKCSFSYLTLDLKYTVHQTSKLSRCLTYLNKSSYKSRNTLGKQCIAMKLKSFLMRILILIKLGFPWICLKLLVGPALVTISWNQVCMYELIGNFRKLFNPLCMCNHYYASYHLTLLHSQ